MAVWEEVGQNEYHEHLRSMKSNHKHVGETRLQHGGVLVHYIGHDYRIGAWVAKKETIGRDTYYYIVKDPQ
jgi:hypothetical protein